MTLTSPGPTLGVVGGGQLGRMLGEAAGPLGVEVVVADPTPDCPAAPVVRDQIVGDFDDPDTLTVLAERADVVTVEIELADPDVLEQVRTETDTPIHPHPSALRTTRDKLAEKQALADAGIPVAGFRAADSPAALRRAGQELGWPVMLKARKGGYDGRGNIPVEGPDDAVDAFESVDGPVMVEAFVDFDRELAVMGVKADSTSATFPVTETIHEAEILRETVCPARTDESVRQRAKTVASKVLELLDGRGIFGIELFECDGDVLVNEIAPRPHNSGHWTIEGCLTSQFEQHIRAVLGWPLGATDRRCPTVTANILGDVQEPQQVALAGVERVLGTSGISLHWYGKREVRPLRKMGHITAVDATPQDSSMLLARARELRESLAFVDPPPVEDQAGMPGTNTETGK